MTLKQVINRHIKGLEKTMINSAPTEEVKYRILKAIAELKSLAGKCTEENQ